MTALTDALAARIAWMDGTGAFPPSHPDRALHERALEALTIQADWLAAYEALRAADDDEANQDYYAGVPVYDPEYDLLMADRPTESHEAAWADLGRPADAADPISTRPCPLDNVPCDMPDLCGRYDQCLGDDNNWSLISVDTFLTDVDPADETAPISCYDGSPCVTGACTESCSHVGEGGVS